MKIIKPHKKGRTAKTNETILRAEDPDLSNVQQLWQAFTSGDRSAFEQLYYCHINLLYDYGVRLGRDTQLAEDCVQDLFTHLWANHQKLPVVKTVKAYLLVSLKRRVYRKLSEQKKDIIKIYETLDPGSYGFDPDTEGHAESISALRQAFARLSEKQKEVVYLRFYNQLTYEEIAEVMEVQVKAIYKLMARAITRLRKHITHPIITQLLLVILAS